MSDDIFVFDDIVAKDYQDQIQALLTGWDFGWVFNQSMVSPDDEFQNQEDNHAGFNHFFFEQNQPKSQHFNFLYPLVLSITSKGIPVQRLIRMRANLTLPNTTSKLDWHMPHIDSFFEHWNAIYYVNDSDGDTVIFNETNDDYSSGQDDIIRIKQNNFTVKQRVTPKKGRVVVFPGKYYHSSSWARTGKYRCVININLSKIMI